MVFVCLCVKAKTKLFETKILISIVYKINSIFVFLKLRSNLIENRLKQAYDYILLHSVNIQFNKIFIEGKSEI